MKSGIQILKKARELRIHGRSLSEISAELNVGVSTLSLWLRDIRLSDQQKSELDQRNRIKVSRGRLNASVMKRANRVFKEKSIYDQAVKEFPHLAKDPFYMMGLSIYWAKGARRGGCFQFTSADRKMVEIMKKWAIRYLRVENDAITEILYGKCIRLNISGIDRYRQLTAWQKLLIQYYDSVSGEQLENMRP